MTADGDSVVVMQGSQEETAEHRAWRRARNARKRAVKVRSYPVIPVNAARVARILGANALFNRREARRKARKAGASWQSVLKQLKRARRS